MKTILYIPSLLLIILFGNHEENHSKNTKPYLIINNDVELMTAALVVPNGHAYFFKGKYYHKYDIKSDKLSLIMPIRNVFQGIPPDVDAALMHPNGKAYFFSGNTYYRFNFSPAGKDKMGIVGQDGWKGLTGPFDGAISHPTNNKAYFFKGNKYYRFDYNTDKMDHEGTIGSSGWMGVPANIDLAIMHSNGKVYFFKGDNYYRYDFAKKRVDRSGRIGVRGWPGLFKKIDSRVDDWRIVSGKQIFHTRSKKSSNFQPTWSLSNWNYNSVKLGYEGLRGVSEYVDCSLMTKDGSTFVFKDDKFYKFNNGKVVQIGRIGYDDWKGIPMNLDAALMHHNGYAYFFKGPKYYRYNFQTKSRDKVGIIGEDGWKGVPKNLDAAYGDSKGAFFYKKSTEYRYRTDKKNVVDHYEIPKEILN